jgi:hypothetical protein
VTQNPFWPLFDEAISWVTGPTTALYSLWVSVKERTEGQGSTAHGKQYELDQYQTGTANSVFRNTDGVFNPTDPAGPYYPMVVPYRGYRLRAQYPATINLLTAAQATAGAQPNDDGSTVVPPALPTGTDSGGGYSSITTAAGTYTTALPASPTIGQNILRHSAVSAAPGVAFTAQCLASSTTTIQLQMRLVWWKASGGTISTSLGTSTSVAGSTLVTVTGTAPANVAGMTIELFINSSPAGTSTVTTNHWQVERNGTASAYVQPNRWYSLFTGLALSYPQDWADSGTYGTMKLSAVDIFGWLSQRKLFSPAYMEILALSPTFLYCLDEPAGVTSFRDATGNYTQAAVTRAYGSGTIALAMAGTSLLAPTTAQGFGGPVVAFTNPPGGGSTAAIDIGARGTVGPPTATSWSRTFAVHFTAAQLAAINAAGVLATIWWAQDVTGNSIWFYMNGAGNLHIEFYKQGSVSYIQGVGTLSADSWHLINFAFNLSTGDVTTWIDGVVSHLDPGPGPQIAPSFVAGAKELIGGAYADGSAYLANDGWAGEISYVSEVPFAFTPAQVTLLYATFSAGGQSDSAGNRTSATRYADILRWAQYQGHSSIDAYATAQTVQYGPPTDLYASRDQSGNDVVSALQTVVDTENGVHYVAGNGAVTFKSRRARYNQNTPVVTFGENTAAGEIPYVTSPLNYDPTRITNDAQITQSSTNAVTRVLNATSITTYGDIPLQRNVNSLDPYEITAAGQFLVGRNGVPQQRIQSITIPASSFTIGGAPSGAAWAALLPLDVGARVRIMRRPPGATVIQIDGFVESKKFNRDDQTSGSFDLQISSAAGLAFWQVASTHTTLNTAAAAGAVTAVINPLPDSATNPIQANISGADNAYEWVIDWGLATAEYVTVYAPAPNAPGYATATLTLGACKRLDTGAVSGGFNFAHSAGAVLQDIGGYLGEAGANTAALATYLNPTNALDAYSTLGTTTIVGY